jgi:hypothetical protein
VPAPAFFEPHASGGPSRCYKRRVRRILAFVALAVVAGCAHGEAPPKLKVSLLPKLVLQPEDVPPQLQRFDVGRVTRFDVPEGPRADPARFGRLDGWKADYKTEGGVRTAGPLVVHSQVDLFGSTDGARKDLDAYRQQFQAAQQAVASVVLLKPKLGDDAVGVAMRQGGNPGLRILTVAWIEGRLSASVTVNGFSRVTRADVLRLARRQQQRILAVAG